MLIKNIIIYFIFAASLYSSSSFSSNNNVLNVRVGCIDNINCYLKNDDVTRINLFGARNQKVNGLVVVTSIGDVGDVEFHLQDLNQIGGERVIGNENVRLRYVLGWFRESSANKSIHHTNGTKTKYYYDLIAKDGKLLKSNLDKHETAIKVQTINGGKYVEIKALSKIGVMKRDGRIKYTKKELFVKDTERLSAINLDNMPAVLLIEINTENILMPGAYVGQLSITADKKVIRVIDIHYTVENIVLDEPEIDYCIYYRGKYKKGEETYSSEYKTIWQLTKELKNINKAGFNCITLYQDWNKKKALDQYLTVFKKMDFDKYIIFDSKLISFMEKSDMKGFRNRLEIYKSSASIGNKVYLYMIDEPTKYENALLTQFRRETILHGFYPVTTGRFERIKQDVENGMYVVAYRPNKVISDYMHLLGSSVYSYANPQVGVLAPYQYRMNYGLMLHINDYDGAMPYAYQDSRGGQWDDEDGSYRDHMFTYPVAGGVLETLSWLGMQEAIVDSRYISTKKNLVDKVTENKCLKEKLSLTNNETSLANIGDWVGLDAHRSQLKYDILFLQKTLNKCK